jgi:ring-1,2-phenylacetyl-CoA epoxidase subunit PaaA
MEIRMTQTQIIVKNPSDYFGMPKEYQDLVLHQLRQHAEGELIGADDYLVYFYPMAPNAFERKVCCERASEEVDHFMRAAAVLKDIGYDASHMLKQNIDQRQFYKTEGVVKIKNWIMRGFFSFIGEAAVLALIEEMSLSSYVPIAEMTKQVIIDEYTHVVNGRRIVENFVAQYGAAAAQADFEETWSMALDLFGDSKSERSQQYLKWGLRQYSNGESRERFIRKMTPQLEALGFTVPLGTTNRKFL